MSGQPNITVICDQPARIDYRNEEYDAGELVIVHVDTRDEAVDAICARVYGSLKLGDRNHGADWEFTVLIDGREDYPDDDPRAELAADGYRIVDEGQKKAKIKHDIDIAVAEAEKARKAAEIAAQRARAKEETERKLYEELHRRYGATGGSDGQNT